MQENERYPSGNKFVEFFDVLTRDSCKVDEGVGSYLGWDAQRVGRRVLIEVRWSEELERTGRQPYCLYRRFPTERAAVDWLAELYAHKEQNDGYAEVVIESFGINDEMRASLPPMPQEVDERLLRYARG